MVDAFPTSGSADFTKAAIKFHRKGISQRCNVSIDQMIIRTVLFASCASYLADVKLFVSASAVSPRQTHQSGSHAFCIYLQMLGVPIPSRRGLTGSKFLYGEMLIGRIAKRIL